MRQGACAISIFLTSDFLPVDQETIDKLYAIIVFLIKFHIQYWFRCEDAVSAPSLDLEMLKLSLTLPQMLIPVVDTNGDDVDSDVEAESGPPLIEPGTSESNDNESDASESDEGETDGNESDESEIYEEPQKTLQTVVTNKLFELSYYLSVHLIPLALFDPKVTLSVKSKIVHNMKTIEGSSKENNRFNLKPVFKVIPTGKFIIHFIIFVLNFVIQKVVCNCFRS